MSELPKGWEWVSLDQIRPDNAPIIYGILQPGHDVDDGVRYVRPTEIVNDHIDVPNLRRTTPEIANRYKRAALLANDIVFSIVGSIGKVAVVPRELIGANITQSSARIRPDSRIVEPLYLKRAMKAPLFVEQCNDYQLGSAVPRLNLEDVRKLRIPLAPLSEQRRIVVKLEKLLSRVDAAQARLASIARILKRFRQSVLASACSGRLTVDWRGDRKQEWRSVFVQNVADDIAYGFTASASSDSTGVKFLRITDIQDGKVDWNSVPYCHVPDQSIERFLLASGDIVFTRTGATTGKSFLIRDCPLAVFASYLIRVRTNEKVIPEFLYLFFQSDDYWSQVIENTSGSAQPNCNASKLANLSFMMPPLAEQQEIVRRVEALFKTADALEARYRTANAHVGKLTQSILAKAFRGELVPQDPNDEPAAALLERIRESKNKPGEKKQRRLTPHSTRVKQRAAS